MKHKALLECLRQHHVRRQAVRTVETALEVLTPEERLIAEHLLIAPYKGNIAHIGQMLDIEQSTIYRRKWAVMDKLGEILRIEN